MQSNKAANLDIQAGQTNVEWMLLEGQCLGSIQMQFIEKQKHWVEEIHWKQFF